MLLAYSRRSNRGEHAVLHYPNAGWRLTKKDRGRFLLLIWGAGVSEKLNVQFSFQPPNPPPLHFLFRSATAGKSICSFEQFFFLHKKVKSRWVPLNPSCWYKS